MGLKRYYNTSDSYIVYSSMSTSPIELSTYLVIINLFMKFIMSKLFQVGEITLPERMGKLTITGKKVKPVFEDGKIKGLAPDWVKTKELWDRDPEAKLNKQLVYHFNEDTNGVRYRFNWSKNRVLVCNKNLFNLKLTRENKRKLSSLVKEGKEYIIKD